MIISLPSGEQIASLSHVLDADEIFIGQSASCQIRLPDRLGNVVDQHVRLTREDQHWYVENLSNRPLILNQTEVPVRSGQRMQLDDGDVIFCGGYQMVASDFTPWDAPVKRMEPPGLTVPEEQLPGFGVTPSTEEDEDSNSLNDPFVEENHHTENSEDKPPVRDTNFVTVADNTSDNHVIDENPLSDQSGSNRDIPLIDILAEADDLDNDWNIHRELWYGKIPHSQNSDDVRFQQPQPTDPNDSDYPVIPQPRISPNDATNYKRSLCHAMLQALDQAMEDLSPDNLAQRFQQTTPPHSLSTETLPTDLQSRIRQLFRWQRESAPLPGFQHSYQHHYQQLIASKSYRLLFLQRFRQALKEQEQHG